MWIHKRAGDTDGPCSLGRSMTMRFEAHLVDTDPAGEPVLHIIMDMVAVQDLLDVLDPTHNTPLDGSAVRNCSCCSATEQRQYEEWLALSDALGDRFSVWLDGQVS